MPQLVLWCIYGSKNQSILLICFLIQALNAAPGPVVHAQFDAGARFSKIAPPSLPPPPPGVAPTPAQVKGNPLLFTFFPGLGLS